MKKNYILTLAFTFVLSALSAQSFFFQDADEGTHHSRVYIHNNSIKTESGGIPASSDYAVSGTSLEIEPLQTEGNWTVEINQESFADLSSGNTVFVNIYPTETITAADLPVINLVRWYDNTYSDTGWKGLGDSYPEGTTFAANQWHEVAVSKDAFTNVFTWDKATRLDLTSPSKVKIYVDHIYTADEIATSVNSAISEDINIYPNPASDVVKVILPTELDYGTTTVEIYSLDGKLGLTQNIEGTSASVNVSNLINGLYIIKVKGNDFTNVKKINIKH